VNSRKCETEIARQFIEVAKIDVLLGGGIGLNNNDPQFNCSQYLGHDPLDVISLAQNMGYAYVTTKSEMNAAVSGGTSKILGLFSEGGKTPETFWVDPSFTYAPEEPTLAEMTAAALDILEEDKDGFFLMVEGSQIDWANHANDIQYQIGETLGFDKAVQIIQNWIDSRPFRKFQTLVIIVADHDCGGFAINGPYGSLSEAGDIVEDGWTSADHTAGDTIIWSQGPGSQELGKALDNTDLFDAIVDVLH
jgi:alkaline phosphatase